MSEENWVRIKKEDLYISVDMSKKRKEKNLKHDGTQKLYEQCF